MHTSHSRGTGEQDVNDFRVRVPPSRRKCVKTSTSTLTDAERASTVERSIAHEESRIDLWSRGPPSRRKKGKNPYTHERRHDSRLCMITVTTKAVDELCHVIDYYRHLLLHTTGMQQPVQSSTSSNCGSSAVSHDCARHAGPAQKRRSPYQCTAAGESLW